MESNTKRFQIIYLGNPYDFVVKDHLLNRTYGTFQGDSVSLQEFLEGMGKENEQLQEENELLKLTVSNKIKENFELKQEVEDLRGALIRCAYDKHIEPNYDAH